MNNATTVTPKGIFKTRLRNRRILSLIQPARPRAQGYRNKPVLIRLDPAPGVIPSEKPPARIYLGTESAQYRAERVFVWSILQVRDQTRAYEIHLMKDLQGFNRNVWKTGFTNYRYAIPALAGKTGRAIYNDVDQIYFADPALLFDTDMQGKAVLSINDKETSVMLLDCEKLADLWRLEDTQRLQKHKYYRAKVHRAGLWGHMAGEWNARDHEFILGKSKLLHFTTLHRQPWQPFPNTLKYQSHALAKLWEKLEQDADAAGFTLFTKENPSPRYHELLAMYATMHQDGRPDTGHTAAETFSGVSLKEHVMPIAELVRSTGAKSVLDFGSGKGKFYQDAEGYPPGSRYKTMPAWGSAIVTCYDPGYSPFSAPFENAYDGVITTDVLEHIPEEDIAWVLDDLFAHARKFVYAVASCYPAKKHLPDGSNAHCTLQLPRWWQGQMELAARRTPGVKWMLCTQEKSSFAFQHRKKLTKKGIRSRFFCG